MADGYCERINNCFWFQSWTRLNSPVRSPLTSKGLALYLGSFFLQPLSHIDMVQLTQVIISCSKAVGKNKIFFATSLVRRDSASWILIELLIKSWPAKRMCATTREMIQWKHAFLIESESVRRMFRAKPAMNGIVVQLLVDSLPDKSTRDKIIDQNKWRFFKLILASSVSSDQISKREYCLTQAVTGQP